MSLGLSDTCPKCGGILVTLDKFFFEPTGEKEHRCPQCDFAAASLELHKREEEKEADDDEEREL